MDPVNRLNRLLETLRQSRQKTDKSQITRSTSSSERPQAHSASHANTHEIADLKRTIIQRLKDCPKEDNERTQRVFFEAVLTWEFGGNLADDPEFASLLNNLVSSVNDHRQLKSKLQKTIALLSE